MTLEYIMYYIVHYKNDKFASNLCFFGYFLEFKGIIHVSLVFHKKKKKKSKFVPKKIMIKHILNL